MGDSHTCTHGAFGAFAAGVGTTDLEVGILKGVCAFRAPKTMRVNITGTLQPGVSAKDVILHIIKELTVNGATDRVIEFRGPVVDAMTMAARMTLCNMAIEAGATCGVCLPDRVTAEYLWPFIKERYPIHGCGGRGFPQMAFRSGCRIRPDPTIDVSDLVPQVTFGFKPDQVKDIGEMAGTRSTRSTSAPAPTAASKTLRAAAEILKGAKSPTVCAASCTPATPPSIPRPWKRG